MFIAVVVPVCIVFIGVIFSLIIKILNKCKGYVIDNTKWLVPLLIALQLYDLYSDILLSYNIFSNPLLMKGELVSNIIFWCGMINVWCIVLPLIWNQFVICN